MPALRQLVNPFGQTGSLERRGSRGSSMAFRGSRRQFEDREPTLCQAGDVAWAARRHRPPHDDKYQHRPPARHAPDPDPEGPGMGRRRCRWRCAVQDEPAERLAAAGRARAVSLPALPARPGNDAVSRMCAGSSLVHAAGCWIPAIRKRASPLVGQLSGTSGRERVRAVTPATPRSRRLGLRKSHRGPLPVRPRSPGVGVGARDDPAGAGSRKGSCHELTGAMSKSFTACNLRQKPCKNNQQQIVLGLRACRVCRRTLQATQVWR